jgi:N-methylhydantoinase B
MHGAGASWSSSQRTNLASLLAEGRQPLEAVLEGDRPVQKSNEGRLELREHEVIRMRGGGGGGLGDPLLRDAEIVAKDVRDRYVTAGHAKVVYGVVLDAEGELDAGATDELRTRLRRDRIGADPTATATIPADTGVAVVVHEDGAHWGCGYCGAQLSTTDQNWRDGVASRERPLAEAMAEAEMEVRDRVEAPRVMHAERFCPSCAGLLAADLFPEGFVGYPAPRLGTPEIEPLGVPA